MKALKRWNIKLMVFFASLMLLWGCVSTEGTSLPETARIEAEVEAETETETESETESESESEESQVQIEEDGEYSSVEEVALYLHTYAKLPDNYITKNQAEKLGWNSKKGNLWDVAPGKSIGGSHYGNYEKHLPEKKGRKYFECDINYDGSYRGAERIIYSNDDLIYYTGDHYKTFELLYE